MNSHRHLRKTVETIGEKFSRLQGTMDMMLAEFQRNLKGKIVVDSSNEVSHENSNESSPRNLNSNNDRMVRTPTSRFEFPLFNGKEINNWIRKCEYYFQFYPMIDEQKLRSVALNVEGEARVWFLAYYKANPRVSWAQFIEDVEIRFGDISTSNVISEFNRLQQVSTVIQYQKKFEFLRALVEAETHGLTEDYVVKCFIEGLKDEIGGFVRLLKPNKLSKAISVARVKESTLEAIVRRTETPFGYTKPVNNFSQNSYYYQGENKPFNVMNINQISQSATKPIASDSIVNTNLQGTKASSGMVKKLTYNDIQSRREKGLYFNYDEMYGPDHKYQNRRIFMMVGDDEESKEITDEEIVVSRPFTVTNCANEEPAEVDKNVNLDAVCVNNQNCEYNVVEVNESTILSPGSGNGKLEGIIEQETDFCNGHSPSIEGDLMEDVLHSNSSISEPVSLDFDTDHCLEVQNSNEADCDLVRLKVGKESSHSNDDVEGLTSGELGTVKDLVSVKPFSSALLLGGENYRDHSQRIEGHIVTISDDAMFRMDFYLAQIFRELRNQVGDETAQSQLVLFKLRVLLLLEIYLHENPGSEQLGQHIWGILQKKIFKAKDHPRGKVLQLSLFESLLQKNLKLAAKMMVFDPGGLW